MSDSRPSHGNEAARVTEPPRDPRRLYRAPGSEIGLLGELPLSPSLSERQPAITSSPTACCATILNLPPNEGAKWKGGFHGAQTLDHDPRKSQHPSDRLF
jgi:hypothetical protein